MLSSYGILNSRIGGELMRNVVAAFVVLVAVWKRWLPTSPDLRRIKEASTTITDSFPEWLARSRQTRRSRESYFAAMA